MRIFAGSNHSGKPVTGCVRVASPQRLNKGRNYIIVIVTIAVIKNYFFLNRFFGSFPADINLRAISRNRWLGMRLPLFRCSFYSKLQGIQKGTGVAVCSINQMLQGAFFKLNIPVAIAPVNIRQSHTGSLKQIIISKRLKLEYARP